MARPAPDSESRLPASLGLPAGIRVFSLAAIAAEPWRNGGGQTRTVAAASAQGEVLWRVSAADIAVEGDFSTFVGMVRTAVLMRGDGLVLQLPDQTLRLPQVGAVARFDGEAPVRARLAQAPAQLWNVMTRRDVVCADTVVLGEGAWPLPAFETAVVGVLAGRVAVRALDAAPPLCVLSPGEGLVCSDASTSLLLEPAGEGGGPPCWVHTTLRMASGAQGWCDQQPIQVRASGKAMPKR